MAVHPIGLARPDDNGRQRYARLSPDLLYASLDAASGRSATYGPLVLSRLLRQQLTRGAAHVSPEVLAADLALPVKLVLALLDSHEAARVIERHRDDTLDSDEARLYTVSLAESEYPIDLGRLNPEQTRLAERIEIAGTRLNVLGSRPAAGLLALTLGELEESVPGDTISESVARAVAGNLTGETMLVEDLLGALRQTVSAASRNASLGLGLTPGAPSPNTSIEEEVEEESFRADARDEEHELNREPQTPRGGADQEQSFDEGNVGAALPCTTEAILYAFDDPKFRRLLSRDLADTLTILRARNDGEPLSADQAEIVDEALARSLYALTSRPGESRARFALYRATIQRTRQADELIAALKSAQPWREPELASQIESLDALLVGATRRAAEV